MGNLSDRLRLKKATGRPITWGLTSDRTLFSCDALIITPYTHQAFAKYTYHFEAIN